MKNNKINYWALLLITIIGSGVAYLLVIKSSTIEYEYQNQSIRMALNNENNQYDVKIEKISENPAWYKSFYAEYPTGNIPGAIIAKEYVSELYDNFECMNDEDGISKEEAEKEEGLIATLSCDVIVTYSYSTNKNFIFHKLSTYSYYGGAHGTGTLHIFVVDKSGKEYQFSDLVKEDLKGNYYDALKEAIKKAARMDTAIDDSIDLEYVFDYILEPEYLKEINFEFSKRKIKFYFSEAQGLSHSVGFLEISVPLTDLKGILKEQYIN